MKLRRMVLATTGLVVACALLEGVLRLRSAWISAVQPEMEPAVFVNDSKVGRRPNPDYPDHDPRGWRNAPNSKSVEVVALGDSQTYGVGVSRADAWPAALARRSQWAVYQMAAPTYAPAHDLLLFDEALQLGASVLVATYYVGNDLYGSYEIAYRRGDMPRTSDAPDLDDLLTTDPRVRTGIQQSEARDPELRRASAFVECLPNQPLPNPSLGILKSAWPALGGIEDTSFPWTLYRRSAVASVMKRGVLALRFELGARLAYRPPTCIPFSVPGLETVFTPAYRLVALDDTDPRIVEGERISLLALQRLHSRCGAHACRLYVLLIPTKEYAFRARLRQHGDVHPYLARLWETEERVRKQATSFLAERHIPVIDSLPALEAVISAGVNPYPSDPDGHPNGAGHGAIAQAVHESLKRDRIVSGMPPNSR